MCRYTNIQIYKYISKFVCEIWYRLAVELAPIISFMFPIHTNDSRRASLTKEVNDTYQHIAYYLENTTTNPNNVYFPRGGSRTEKRLKDTLVMLNRIFRLPSSHSFDHASIQSSIRIVFFIDSFIHSFSLFLVSCLDHIHIS